MNWTAKCRGIEPSRAEMRRRQITDAARKLFVEHGFHATGMAQLASESGVRIGQIYRDFSCKEDLVAALVESDCSRLMMYEQLDTAIRDGDSIAVRAWLHEFIDPGDSRDDGRLFAEIVAESARNDRIATIFQSLQGNLRAHILAALELLAPGPERAERRAVMTEAVMTLSWGLFQYRLMAPERDIAPVLAALNRLLDRELSTLAG